MKNLTNHSLLLWAALLLVTAVLAVVLPFEHGGVFWIAAMGMLAVFILIEVVFNRAFRSRKTLESKVLGWPLFQVGAVALVLQIVIAFVLMALGSRIPVYAALAVELIFAVCVFVLLITKDAARAAVLESEEAVRQQTAPWKTIRMQAAALAEQTGNKDLQKLAEDIHYADPMPSALDEEIAVALQQIADDPTQERIQKAQQLLIQRKAQIKQSKQHA